MERNPNAAGDEAPHCPTNCDRIGHKTGRVIQPVPFALSGKLHFITANGAIWCKLSAFVPWVVSNHNKQEQATTNRNNYKHIFNHFSLQLITQPQWRQNLSFRSMLP
jgi:hypothetical protein